MNNQKQPPSPKGPVQQYSSAVMVPLSLLRDVEADNRQLYAYINDLEIQLAAQKAGCPDEVEEEVISAIRERRERGRKKYGTTMDRAELTPAQWSQHAQEEAMDFVIYLQRLKRDLQNAPGHEPVASPGQLAAAVGSADFKYTGHVPCSNCGTTHWMHGPCPQNATAHRPSGLQDYE